MICDHTFEYIANQIRAQFINQGCVVDVGEWQSFRDKDLPMTKTFELEDVSFIWFNVPDHVGMLQEAVKPNLPWAEDHYQERMAGEPLNPGEQYKNWPWYEQGVEEHKPGGKFSHTYMERYWAGNFGELGARPHGIRSAFGDMLNLKSLLMTRPHTRQAYLPVWFPEDLFAADVRGDRVPCTLGYHFLMREGKLKVTYYMRSCDWFRYFRDDVYMTARLQQDLAKMMGVQPGKLVMHISSLHIFEAEIERLNHEHG